MGAMILPNLRSVEKEGVENDMERTIVLNSIEVYMGATLSKPFPQTPLDAYLQVQGLDAALPTKSPECLQGRCYAKPRFGNTPTDIHVHNTCIHTYLCTCMHTYIYIYICNTHMHSRLRCIDA